MGWAGMAISAVGGIMGAMGQAEAGREANKAEQFNAGVLRANAQAVKTSNEFDIMQQKKVQRRFGSAQQAGYAKAGVKLEGSPLEVMIDTAAQFELDQYISKWNAQTQSSQLQNEADQRIKTGKAMQRSGNAQAASTLLSTAGSAGKSYGNYKTTGTW
jgi:hypothetical protein